MGLQYKREKSYIFIIIYLSEPIVRGILGLPAHNVDEGVGNDFVGTSRRMDWIPPRTKLVMAVYQV